MCQPHLWQLRQQDTAFGGLSLDLCVQVLRGDLPVGANCIQLCVGLKMTPFVASSAAPVSVYKTRGLADTWNTGWKNLTAEPRGHTRAGFAPVTVTGSQNHLGWERSSRSTIKSQKTNATRLYTKTGLSPAPPQARAAQALPQVQLHISLTLGTADVTWKWQFPHKPQSLQAAFHPSAILS